MASNITRGDVEELVYATCERLDEKDVAGYLGLCDAAFTYKVTAWAPEIGREMTWLDRGRGELEEFFKMLPKHNTDPSPLTRHAQVTRVRMDGSGGRAEVTSTFQVFRTQLDSGATELYAVGKYLDTVDCGGGTPKLLARHVRLDTRDLHWGTHLPI